MIPCQTRQANPWSGSNRPLPSRLPLPSVHAKLLSIMTTPTLLVTGAAGMLGKKLLELCPTNFRPVGVDLEDFDITDLDAFRNAARSASPQIILHGAAFTDVDGCESQLETAMKVNGFGARNAALVAEEVGASLVYVSTDYVFDGEKEGEYLETDPTAPKSVYGRTKHAGEVFVTTLTNRFYVVRTQWLYGPGGKNFVDTIAAAGKTRDELTVVNDQRGCPTSTTDLARGIYRILTEDAGYGIYHCSGRGSCTWFDFAVEIVRQTGGKAKVLPMSTEELNRPAPRPRNSPLRNLSLELTVGDPTLPWEESLEHHFATG